MALHLALVLTGLKLRGNSGGSQSERCTQVLLEEAAGFVGNPASQIPAELSG